MKKNVPRREKDASQREVQKQGGENMTRLEEQLVHAKTKEEFVAIGMQLFQTPAFKKEQEDVLSKEWERRQNEGGTKHRRKKHLMLLFWLMGAVLIVSFIGLSLLHM